MPVRAVPSPLLDLSQLPFCYGLDGSSISRAEARRLLTDIERRTLLKSDFKLATGEWVTMRTVGMVFDPDMRPGLPVPLSYRPRLWSTALYTPAPENVVMEVLCTYDDADQAVEEHQQAMTMVAVGTNTPTCEPGWASGLSWTGPGQ